VQYPAGCTFHDLARELWLSVFATVHRGGGFWPQPPLLLLLLLILPTKPFVGELRATLEKYPHIGKVVPAMGYSEQQVSAVPIRAHISWFGQRDVGCLCLQWPIGGLLAAATDSAAFALHVSHQAMCGGVEGNALEVPTHRKSGASNGLLRAAGACSILLGAQSMIRPENGGYCQCLQWPIGGLLAPAAASAAFALHVSNQAICGGVAGHA
jgi:hypothetical protein